LKQLAPEQDAGCQKQQLKFKVLIKTNIKVDALQNGSLSNFK